MAKTTTRRWLGVVLTVAALSAGGLAGSASAAGPAASAPSGTLRLGYFPNVTHAPALVAVQGGLFQSALGPDVHLKLFTFNAGPAAVEALLSDSIDASYVGPNPAINAYAQSHGAVRIIAGAASGGAFLVVRPGINTAADLRGKVLATPQLGNTQDVALRTFLRAHGLRSNVNGGGDVSIRPEDNATTIQAFQQHQIDGAWVPEPYASQLVADGGKVLVDERSLWPGRRFATTELIVRTDYLRAHPDIVQRLLEGQRDAIGVIDERPDPSPAARRAGPPGGDRAGREAERHRGVVPVDHLHQRPDRLVGPHPSQGRRAARAARHGEPERALRPADPQPGLEGGRAADRVVMSLTAPAR